ncbi:MAG: HEAT repeat domain-containing protein [Armatimonadota bacterium]
MEGRRRPMGYVIVAVVALILIGWLTYRYMGKRQLIRALGSRDLAVRTAAAQRLLDMGKLSDALPAQSIIVRSKTAEALGEIGSDDALGVLGEILADQEEAPRRWARRALVKQGMRAMPVLLAALSAGGGTRDEAITALKQIGPQTADEIRFFLSDRGAYAGAAKALAQLGPQGVAPLLRACYTVDGDLREQALNNLGLQRVEAAVDAALYNLGKDPNNRKGPALKALGFIGDRRAVPTIIPFLKVEGNREAAVTSLGLLRDPRAVEPILATLTVRVKRYRNAAILALRRIGAPAFPALVRELRSPDLLMREGAAAALIGSASPAVNGPLSAALKDSDPDVRASAARALGWSGNVAAVPPLVGALSDSSWVVVDSAVAALGSIGVPAVDPLLAMLRRPSGGLTVDYQIARGLAAMGRQAVPKLTAALSDQNPNVQKWSSVALGTIGDPRAVEGLKRLANTAGPDIRWVAQEQLRRLTSLTGS